MLSVFTIETLIHYLQKQAPDPEPVFCCLFSRADCGGMETSKELWSEFIKWVDSNPDTDETCTWWYDSFETMWTAWKQAVSPPRTVGPITVAQSHHDEFLKISIIGNPECSLSGKDARALAKALLEHATFADRFRDKRTSFEARREEPSAP